MSSSVPVAPLSTNCVLRTASPIPLLTTFTLSPMEKLLNEVPAAPVSVSTAVESPELLNDALPDSTANAESARPCPARFIAVSVPSVTVPNFVQSASAVSARLPEILTPAHAGTVTPEGMERSGSDTLEILMVVIPPGTASAIVSPESEVQVQFAAFARSAAEETAPPFQTAVAGRSVVSTGSSRSPPCA